jgi:hypothetical protein
VAKTKVAKFGKRTRISDGNYVAEIIPRRYVDVEIFHYVIQPKGSREVVSYGQERTLEDAQRAVRMDLDELLGHTRAAGQS